MGIVKQILVIIIILGLIYTGIFIYLAYFRTDIDLNKIEIFKKAPKLLWGIIKEI